MKEENVSIAVAVSFFLVLFLSLKRAVEMWKIHGPTEPWLRILDPTTRWLTVDVRARARSGEGDAYSDVVLRGLDYKGCSFSGEVGEKGTTNEQAGEHCGMGWLGLGR